MAEEIYEIKKLLDILLKHFTIEKEELIWPYHERTSLRDIEDEEVEKLLIAYKLKI